LLASNQPTTRGPKLHRTIRATCLSLVVGVARRVPILRARSNTFVATRVVGAEGCHPRVRSSPRAWSEQKVAILACCKCFGFQLAIVRVISGCVLHQPACATPRKANRKPSGRLGKR